MKKRICLLLGLVLLFIGITLFYRLSAENERVLQPETVQYEKKEGKCTELEIMKASIPLADNVSVGPFCCKKNMIYYTVFYLTDYFIGHETMDAERTEIRCYDMDKKEDSIVFQYDSYVEITDMQCNGEVLIWEDYGVGDVWEIQQLSLADGERRTLLKYEDSSQNLFSVTLTLDDDKLYWYDANMDNPQSMDLKYYDLSRKESGSIKEQLSLKSPFEHVSIVNHQCTVYQNMPDKSIINSWNLKTKKNTAFAVSDDVCRPIGNEKLCIWSRGYDGDDRDILYYYDGKADSVKQIKTDMFFSYGLIDDIIVVKVSDKIFYYDTSREVYGLLWDEEGGYGYTYQGSDNCVYFEKLDSENFEFVCIRKADV